MRINPIQFNFIKTKPQNAANCPLQSNTGLQKDVVSFTGIYSEDGPKEIMKSLVPKHKGLIYEKVRDENGKVIGKIPIEVNIVKETPNSFYLKKDNETVGRVELSYVPSTYCGDGKGDVLRKNYEEEGIVGDRIEVDYIYNQYGSKYGGIGHLADLIEVACCKELGIEPNIISLSLKNAAPFHYVRGKRFIPFEKYFGLSEINLYDLKDKNPNDMVKEVVDSKREDENYDNKTLVCDLLMYMPKKMVHQLEDELKEHPIF